MKTMILMGCGALALAGCGDATAENSGASADDATEVAAKATNEGSQAYESAAQADASVDEQAPAVAKVACAADEQELFSCAAGSKQIAVCGVTNAQGQRTAQYRFGGSGKPEIVLDGGRFASVGYSGGGEAQIEFANGGVRYIVYSRTVRTGFDEEGNKPEFTDGVLVVRGDDVIAERNCTGKVESVDVMAGDAYGGAAGELFHYD
tara:strand:+ start:4418 stop:5035 length:618 start_codon:yes stop_codon:yes gene_type:complete